MIPSPTDEIKAIRRKLSARLGNDVHRIAEDLRRREMTSGRTYITLPRREPAFRGTLNHSLPPTSAVR